MIRVEKIQSKIVRVRGVLFYVPMTRFRYALLLLLFVDILRPVVCGVRQR